MTRFGRWLARRRLYRGPHYMQQIAILKTDKPLPLPPIQPLKATSKYRWPSWARKAS